MILVVEDHPDSRATLLALLALEGYETHSCGSGRDALAFLRDNQPQLVILDCGLPDIDGLAVLRAIRSDQRLNHTRVIMFSAFDGSCKDDARAAGVDAFVLKGSLDSTRLIADIRRLAGPSTHRLESAESS